MIRMKGDHHARTPSCFAVADGLVTKKQLSDIGNLLACEGCVGLRESPCQAHIPARDV
jgi:hypothetical protein